MTIEEKAKAYDEAIKRAKPLMLDTNFSMKNTVISIFPELNESEDERIRKEMIAYFQDIKEVATKSENLDKWIAYLEKQKAKERLDRMAPIYNDKESFESALEKAWKYYNESASRKVDSFEDDYIECVFSKGFREGFLYKEKQKEQSPSESCDDLCCGDDRFKIIGEAKKDIIEKTNIAENELSMELPLLDGILMRVWQVGWLNKKQKPAEWSKEDEEMRITILQEIANIKEVFPKINIQPEFDWLKSLPERFNLQPKQEWSEDWREEDIQTRFAFYTYKDDPSVLYLSNVFVEETSRNNGFGTRILRAAEKVAETIGATTIRLKVKQNSPANAWYRKNGYGYVTFEDGYDWLEKNIEYIKPDKSVEWSEKDNIMFENIILCLKEYCLTDEIKWLKSLRPQSHKEIYQAAKHDLAIKFMNYLDDNRPKDKMCLSNSECEDIDKTFNENDWAKIVRYIEKYKPQWKPSDKQMEALDGAQGELCGTKYNEGLCSLIDDLKKLL